MNKDLDWTKQLAFYLSSMGTAFGLGNLWRFPYVVSDYGGGAFVFLYLLLAVFIGAPLVVSEISLAKYLNTKSLSLDDLVQKKTGVKKFCIYRILSWLPAILAFMVLSYYAVLSSWSLYLIFRSLRSLLQDIPFRGELSFLSLKKSSGEQFLFLLLHLSAVAFISFRGLKKGVQKWLRAVVPLFLVALLFVSYKILTVTDLLEAAKYMIYPNFHMMSFKTFSYALGHVLFTMSLGLSIYLSFGVNFPAPSKTGVAGVRIALLDTFISLVVGFIIFPVIIVSSYQGKMSEAVFRALPNFLESEFLSVGLALSFYLCIFFAAVNASLALVEAVSYRLRSSFNLSRPKSLSLLFALALLASCMIAVLNRVYFFNGSFIEIIDDICINIFLPLSAIVLSLMTLFFVDKRFLQEELNADSDFEKINLYWSWKLYVLFIFPGIYILSLVLRLFT